MVELTFEITAKGERHSCFGTKDDKYYGCFPDGPWHEHIRCYELTEKQYKKALEELDDWYELYNIFRYAKFIGVDVFIKNR